MSNNRKTLYSTIAMVFGMFGLAYGSVPLYELFCKETGYDGTTKVAFKAPEKTLNRTMTIRFNSDISPDLPWEFKPEIVSTNVRVGEEKLAFFEAKNDSDMPVTGTATYNVTPAKAGVYFNKVQCFCFNQQTINPGETVKFPVSFFVDPSIINDTNLDDVSTITLSYTFFPVKRQ